MSQPLIRRALCRGEGFTLVELLVSMGLLTIGIVGVGAALLAQSGGLSSGSSYGLAAITRANYISTAAILAQERLEQIKNAVYCLACGAGSIAVDGITATNFPDEGLGCVNVVPPVPPCTGSNFPNFRRTVVIVNPAVAPATQTKTITVNVWFRPPRDVGLTVQEEVVQLVTYIAQRP